MPSITDGDRARFRAAVETLRELGAKGYDLRCETCGAACKPYKHVMNKGLVFGLRALYAVVEGVCNIKDLKFDHSVWDNFQKLRYFDLVEGVESPDGERKAGWWRITNRGRLFVDGKIKVPLAVWTYRGERTHYDDSKPKVYVHQAVLGWKRRKEWAADSGPDEGSLPSPPPVS